LRVKTLQPQFSLPRVLPKVGWLATMTGVTFCNMIVFDASTLILIAKIEILGYFLDSSELQVCIPREVAQECCAVKHSFDALLIHNAIDESKIMVAAVRDRKLGVKLRRDFSLGLGEAEAIALAHSERAVLVGIDDKNGINACKLLAIPFTTAIGILIRMREKELLTTEEALVKLTQLGQQGRYKRSILEDPKRRLEAGDD
jgi:predicted nucleic acid-binding protein